MLFWCPKVGGGGGGVTPPYGLDRDHDMYRLIAMDFEGLHPYKIRYHFCPLSALSSRYDHKIRNNYYISLNSSVEIPSYRRNKSYHRALGKQFNNDLCVAIKFSVFVSTLELCIIFQVWALQKVPIFTWLIFKY